MARGFGSFRRVRAFGEAPHTADGLAMSRKQRSRERSFTMAYALEELSLELIDALVLLMPRIKQRDKSLEEQLRRAASSIGLNIAEAALSSWKQACVVATQPPAARERLSMRCVGRLRGATCARARPTRALELVRQLVAILRRIARASGPESRL